MAVYDDLINNNNLTQEQKIAAIKARGEAERKDIDKNLRSSYGRMGLGTLLSGASMHPIFNIPYVGTGIGGAMYDAGQAIVEGEKLPDIAKRAGRGFAVGETVGAIPYAGKYANKLSGGKIGNTLTAGVQKLASTPLGQKVAEIVAFSPEQIKTNLYDYLTNDSVLTKGFRENKDIIDKTLLNSVRKGKVGLNPLGKRQGEILYNELSNNSNDILDLTGVFDTKVSNSEVKNYIQSLVNEGAMQTKSPDFLIDIPDHRKYKKHIQFRDKWQKLPREVQERHNALALRLKEIINNSEYSAPPKPNNNPAKKGNVDQYHYFTVKVKIGDDVIPIVLDAEQLIGESTVKPQTVHLYNFKEKK